MEARRISWFVAIFCVLFCLGERLPITKGQTCSKSFNYKDALSKAILFLEGQRSGYLPKEQRVTWRADSALTDGKLDNVDLVGGYYDAGDNVKFVWPMSFTVSLLSMAATEYEQQMASAGELDNLRSAIAWGADFIMKCHPSDNVFYGQVGEANNDHNCWERPEDMDTYRELYKVTPDSPGTEAAAEGAAALAAASIVFKSGSPSYSAQLLDKAYSLFELADGNKGSYKQSCPFYCPYGDYAYQDELLWAATWLYKAGGRDRFLNYVVDNQQWSQTTTEFGWENKIAGTQALLTNEYFRGNENLRKYRDQFELYVCAVMPGSSLTQIKTTEGGVIFVRDGSMLQYVTGASMLLNFYAKMMDDVKIESLQCGSTKFDSTQIVDFVRSQIDYILGCNPMKMSYMVGFGGNYPTQLHHRGASIPSISVHPEKVACKEGFSSYLHTNRPNPNVHVGALAGGPDRNDEFKDMRSDSTYTEPTTYTNAAFVGSIAALL